MTQTINITDPNHLTFVKQVVETGQVWILDNEEDGVAVSSSNNFDDVAVIPLWSDETAAKAHAHNEWSAYHTVATPLATFLEAHVVLMSNDEVLVGTNWDLEMLGQEMEPTALALDIIAELKAQNKTLTFENYQDLGEYEKATQDAWKLVQASYE